MRRKPDWELEELEERMRSEFEKEMDKERKAWSGSEEEWDDFYSEAERELESAIEAEWDGSADEGRLIDLAYDSWRDDGITIGSYF